MRGQTAIAVCRASCAALLSFAEDRAARRQVSKQRRPAEGGVSARRNRRVQIRAEFAVHYQSGNVFRDIEEVRAERHRSAEQRYLRADGILGGAEVALFVVFLV